MCVILACANVFPSREVLWACERRNGDGGGVAWANHGLVHWEKNLTAAEIHQLIQEQVVTMPAVIHFRLGNVGAICPELCHPFPITPGAELDLQGATRDAVLFHNVTWPDWQAYVGDLVGSVSDSRVVARQCALQGLDLLDELGGQAGRFAVLNVNGELQRFGPWQPLDGIIYSNLRWQN